MTPCGKPTERSRQRERSGLLAGLLLMIGAIALWCGSAQALTQRGHVFGFSFADAGTGVDELSGPSGVAVDEETGDVYVVDGANDRLERFGPNGEFIAVWGWGVKDGKAEYEICEAGCQAGIAGDGKGQFRSPQAIAVDNSTSGSGPSRGDVYVVADDRDEHSRLEKFSSTGELLGSVKQAGVEAKWEGALDGIGVDEGGRLWVYRGVEAEGIVERFSDALKNGFEEPALEAGVLCPKSGFAVDGAGDRLYVDHERTNREEECPSEWGQTPLPVLAAQLEDQREALSTRVAALDPLQTTGIASEAKGGGTYVGNVASVAAFDASGSFVQRLSLPGEHPATSGLAANAATGRVYVADSAQARIDVFDPEGPGRPTVDGISAQNLTPTSVKLSAQINPTGSDTRYYFAYGTADCQSSPSSCTDLPAPPGSDIGDGFADQPATVELQGLKPSATYYYRVIATNEHGQAEGSETFGTITTLPSAEGVLPDGRGWELVSPAEKDGSSVEPLRNEGGLIQASEDGSAISYVANGPIVPEPEGNRAPYPTQAIATRTDLGWSSQQIVTPRVTGEGFIPGEAPEYRFFSPDLSSGLVQPDNGSAVEPLEQPPLAPEATEKTMYLRETSSGRYLPLVTSADDSAHTQFGGKLHFLDATNDLSHVVFSAEVPLALGSGAGLYEWQSGRPLEPVSVLPDHVPALEPALGAEDRNVRGAVSSDGSRVFWTGESETERDGASETVRHLYMRDMTTAQTLQVDAAAAGISEPGEEESEVGFQAASSSGSRVFFTDTTRLTEDSKLEPLPGVPGNPADLYECEVVEQAEKLACDLKDLTVDENPGEGAEVLNVAPAVSEDGSYVYFVANGVLAPGASRGHCVRSDGETPPPEATCNLYVWHEGTISFIATLSNEDSGDWGSTEGGGERGQSVEERPDLADVTAGASPNGQYLAFMSKRRLTGFNSVDANPAAGGAADEEVFLYDANTKLITCASCNPDGEQPDGVLDTRKAGEGLGLLVDRRDDWSGAEGLAAPTDHWLAANLPGWTPLGVSGVPAALRQPRYLSNTGRLFFNSAAALVGSEGARTRQEVINGQPTQVGVENVYEYEPNNVGSCTNQHGCVGLISSGTAETESAFVDASATGDDAFFVTAQPLVAADHDTNVDLYDARVCTTQSPCFSSEVVSRSSCESSSSCRPAQSPVPAATAPSGSALPSVAESSARGAPAVKQSGPSRKARTRAQKLAKALKNCRKRWRHNNKKRAGCERQAHKAYGPNKAGHRSKRGTK